MKPQEANIVPFQTLDESKQEAQGLFRDPPAGDGHKQIKNQLPSSTSSKISSLLVLLSVMLFAIILIAINEHYSKIQNNKSGQEPKIVTKPNDAGINQDIHQQQKIFEDLSKQVTLIKNDIFNLSKALENDHSNIDKKLDNLKYLILSNAEKTPAQSAKEQSSKDERSFEADLAETAPNNTEEIFTESSESYVDDKYVFSVPKKLWLYEPENSSYLRGLIHDNNIYFAKKSRYDVLILSRNNYKKHVSQKGAEAIQKLIGVLKKRVQADQKSNLKNHLQSIIKKVILLMVLKQNGGIMANGNYAMTEDFQWISDIVRNQYVNRGNRGIKPQVVGFYVPYYSFKKVKENKKPFAGMQPVDKYMVIFPSLEDYFMAAVPESDFLGTLLTQIIKLLTNPDDFKRERGKYKLNNLNGNDIYYEYILIASQIVLQQKQKQIDQANIDQYRHFAIDYYGLNLINCHYAPEKLKVFWGNWQSDKLFQSLSQYTLEQLEANFGPMRYIVRLNPVAEINRFLQETKNGKKKMILEGSFIQKILYPTSNVAFLKKNEEEPFLNKSSEPWLTLPKIIWIFWDEGLSNAFVNNQLCVQNLRRKGKESGFELREVNMSNAHQYLDQKTLDKINYTMKNAKLKSSRQHLSDFMRLALVSKYGGIYMDASYVALQNFDWIINIGKYPSQYIFNRYGSLPKVLMTWHPQYGSPLDWTIDKKYNTKAQWHLAYQSNFIAAEKGSEFVTEWFELMMELYVKPYSQVQKIFQDCLIKSHKWMSKQSHYLIVMDTVKCVVGRREAKLRRNGSKEYVSASDYYKVWSISGYIGPQKFRSNTNFDEPGSQDNKLVYMYSQEYAEGLVGKIRHLIKFYSQHNKEMNLFVSRHMDSNFSSQTHPDSFFMRHMWDKRYKLKEVNSYPRLKPMQ